MSVSAFLQSIKSKADEFNLIDAPVSDDDLTLFVLNGLGHAYREIAGPIRSRETPLKFVELHDLLVEHEQYLKHLEAANSSLVATANMARGNQSRGSVNNNNRNRGGP